MFRYLPLLLLAACSVDKSAAGLAPAANSQAEIAVPTPSPTPEPAPTPLPVPRAPDPVPVPTPPAQAPNDGSLLLAAGEQAEIAAKTTLRYDRMVNDSRCPAGVQCVWAGEVRLALTLTRAGKAEPFELASAREDSRVVQGFAVTLLDFGPCPLGHGAPQQECATLSVTPPPE